MAATNGTFCGQAMTTGDIYTVAGNGTSGFSGDGGPATAAEVAAPAYAVASSTGMQIADTANSQIRFVQG